MLYVEMDMRKYVSKESLAAYMPEISSRAKRRKSKREKARKEENKELVVKVAHDFYVEEMKEVLILCSQC